VGAGLGRYEGRLHGGAISRSSGYYTGDGEGDNETADNDLHGLKLLGVTLDGRKKIFLWTNQMDQA
jgi:hypothetical protein